MNTPEFCLYILMRTDLASMNAGKAVAHGAHAANQFEQHFDKVTFTAKQIVTQMGNPEPTKTFDGAEAYKNYVQWSRGTNGLFGTTITLASDIGSISSIVMSAHENDLIAGVVFDPTYPLRDGSVTHLIPLNTCAYVFMDRNNIAHREILSSLSLML